jgi:hypothetical protein
LAKRNVGRRSIRSDKPKHVLFKATSAANFEMIYTRADLYVGYWVTFYDLAQKSIIVRGNFPGKQNPTGPIAQFGFSRH